MTKAYQAYAKGCTVTASTPYEAAARFFEKFPQRRKCDVTGGHTDGPFFVVKFGRHSNGEWPARFKDVTKKTMETLPRD